MLSFNFKARAGKFTEICGYQYTILHSFADGLKNLKSKEEVDKEQHNQLVQEESQSRSKESESEDG